MNAIFRVRMISGTPQLPRPACLAESEEWAPGYAAAESVEGKEWAKYELIGISQAGFDAAKLDTENYEWISTEE